MESRIDLEDLLQLVRRRGWIVALSVALALATAYGVTRLIAPTYEAAAKLFVDVSVPGAAPGVDLQYTSVAQGLVTTYADLAETRAVAEAAARRLDVPPAEIVGHVEADTQPGVQTLQVRARAGSAVRAAAFANAVAKALASRAESLTDRGSSSIRIEVVDAAVAPSRPASPRLVLILLFGALAGLMSGVGLALARERTDTVIRSEAQAEGELGLPVLGGVFRLSRRLQQEDALARHAHPRLAERYRSIAIALRSVVERGGQRRILITSAGADEGKTTVAVHLALALAEDGRQVALAEGDLRRPSLRSHFPAEGAPGLSDVIHRSRGRLLPESTAVAPGVKVLAAEESYADPGPLLRSSELERTLERAVEDHDYLLLDGPPVLAVSDAAVLARYVNAVVLVVRVGRSRAEDLRAAHGALRRLGVDVVGVVLVGTPLTRQHRAYEHAGADGAARVRPRFDSGKRLRELSRR
jgi:polysaccharide biosynthesis transport protein